MKLSSLIADASRQLARAGVASPEVDARIIAASLLGVAPLMVRFAEPYAGFEDDFRLAVARRVAREPLQHITGKAPFGPHELTVGPGVFVPRPETEVLAEWGARLLACAPSNPPVAIDLGTGSGALAVYLKSRVPGARVVGVDKQKRALEYARANGEDVEFVEGDMTDPDLLPELTGAVDVIVANPPYVPETPDLDPEVYFDPHEAVFSGDDGMDAIRGLVPAAARLLTPGGQIGIEHDDSTSELVQACLRAHGGFGDVRVMQDLTGRNRFVVASKLPLCPQPPTTV